MTCGVGLLANSLFEGAITCLIAPALHANRRCKLSKWIKKDVLWVKRDLLKSPAWFALRGKSCQVLGMFWYKRQMEEVKSPGKKRKADYLIKNNGDIVFPYEEARLQYGISWQAFSRALDDLIEHGFIDITELGTGISGFPSKYALSERWRKWGTPEFEIVQRRRRCTYKFPSGGDHPEIVINERRKKANQV